MDIPSRVRPATEAEKVQEVGVQEASDVYVRVGAVTGPLDATYCGPYRVMVSQGEEEAAPGSGGQTAVGLNRPPEAANSGSGPSSCAAASTWPSPQVIVYNKVY